MTQVKYCLTAHTSRGFRQHVKEGLGKIKQTVVIDHPSIYWTTSIMKQLMDTFKNKSLEIIVSSSGEHFIEGVVLPEDSVAFLTNTAFVSYCQYVEGATVYSVDIYREQPLEQDVQRYDQLLQEAYRLLDDGRRKHDLLEEIYVTEINSQKANDLAEELICERFGSLSKKAEKGSYLRRFFGTNTPFGSFNTVPSLLKRTKTADLIHGRAGTGKSTLMKKLADHAFELGYVVELYHCSFDPDSIDMVLVPELEYCALDATEPHAFNPTESGQRIIDTYAAFVTEKTDERYREEIDQRTKNYKKSVQSAKEKMNEARTIVSKIETKFCEKQKQLDENMQFVIDDIVSLIKHM